MVKTFELVAHIRLRRAAYALIPVWAIQSCLGFKPWVPRWVFDIKVIPKEISGQLTA